MVVKSDNRSERRLRRWPGRLQLRDWLHAEHLTQRAFAARVGLHPTNVNHILRGRTQVGLTVALRLEQVTHIPVAAWATARKRGTL